MSPLSTPSARPPTASRTARAIVGAHGVELALAAASVLSSLLVWLPYRHRMELVYRYWDGPSYLDIAREGYVVASPLAAGKSPPWLLAHFPLYPLTIRALAFLGYPRAMLLATVLATITAALLFYRLARDVWRVPSPGLLALIFLVVPPRWLLYHSVGASEPLFLALVLASIFCFEKDRIGWACAIAGLAALTRASGIMILPAYALLLVARGRRRSLPWLLLIPSGFGAFLLYSRLQFGSFLAPFEPNLDKLSSPVPFAFLAWLIGVNLVAHAEFHIYLAGIFAIGISRISRFRVPMTYAAFQLAFYLFVSSEDWSRYFLAMAPFALVLGFRDILTSRPVRWMLPAYVAVATFYAWNVIPKNLCPEPAYARLLQLLAS